MASLVEKIIEFLRNHPSVPEVDTALVEEFVQLYPSYAEKVSEEIDRHFALSVNPKATELAYFMGKGQAVKEVKPEDTVTVDEIDTPDLLFTVHRPTNRLLLMAYKRQPLFVFEMPSEDMS